MADLVTCPLAPGLAQVGTPLVDPAWPHDLGVVYCIESDGTPSAFWSWDQSEPENPRVDLTDETGEQHAASWCAERVGMKRRGARLVSAGHGRWLLFGTHGVRSIASYSSTGSIQVPTLTGIPHTDDGRRQALAALVEYLMTQSEAP